MVRPGEQRVRVGVLVTTSHLDGQAYKEIREDGHPVVVLAGRDITDTLKKRGLDSPATLRRHLHDNYRPRQRDAEDLVQEGIASPDGDFLQVSGALPGSVHDQQAERVWGVPHGLVAAGLVTLADKGRSLSLHGRSMSVLGMRRGPVVSQQDLLHRCWWRWPGCYV